MDETKVNAFIAKLVPPTDKVRLAVYIKAAVRALGGRSDADLARTMNVAPSTLASWKARGAIPEDQVTWFTTTLVPKIAEYRSDLPQASNTARAAAVELLTRTSGNPMQVDRFPIYTTATMLGAILAVAEFLVNLEAVDPRMLDSKTVDRIADLLEGAMIDFRSRLAPMLIG